MVAAVLAEASIHRDANQAFLGFLVPAFSFPGYRLPATVYHLDRRAAVRDNA